MSQDKELVDKKITQIKDKNQSEKIEHDKYIKILEENNKELMDKYELTSKENAELKTINNEEIRLNELCLSKDRLIITYNYFLKEYSHYLKHKQPENT